MNEFSGCVIALDVLETFRVSSSNSVERMQVNDLLFQRLPRKIPPPRCRSKIPGPPDRIPDSIYPGRSRQNSSASCTGSHDQRGISTPAGGRALGYRHRKSIVTSGCACDSRPPNRPLSREYPSITEAMLRPPAPRLSRNVISPYHTWFGASGTKPRSTRSGSLARLHCCQRSVRRTAADCTLDQPKLAHFSRCTRL